MQRQSGQIVTDASQITDVSSYFNMLIVDHSTVDSYETLNILNYYGFPLNKVEEEDFVGNSRKAFDFSKTDEYPFLIINSSHEDMPECDLTGRQNILTFLYNNSLIGRYRSYSAFEDQGLDFVNSKL